MSILSLVFFFFPFTVSAQNTSKGAADYSTNVLMVEIEGVTPNSADLYKAIRAQLSASSLTITQVIVNQSEFDFANPTQSALQIATSHQAEMVFWIRDDQITCTVSFFSSRERERVYNRVLNLQINNQSSRFEVIANAVSSLLEETIITFQKKHIPEPSTQTPTPAPVPTKQVPKRKLSELFLAYEGTLFSENTVNHGVRMGLGFFPSAQLAVDIAYTQNLTMNWQTESFRFSISSRKIDFSLAGRLTRGIFEFRLGLAYSAHLRSLSSEAISESITSRPSRLEGIHSLVPFFVMSWALVERFSLSIGLGAPIALNEHDYKIARDDDSYTSVVSPFSVKLMYHAGFVIQL